MVGPEAQTIDRHAQGSWMPDEAKLGVPYRNYCEHAVVLADGSRCRVCGSRLAWEFQVRWMRTGHQSPARPEPKLATEEAA